MLCLGRRSVESDTPPFPYRQLFVLSLCRICEPIAFMSIFPYVYYMIDSFHMTEDDQKIAFFAGLVTSAFAFAEFLAGYVWGRISDRFGRKPILLCGLAGTGISMIAFGFSRNLATALIARALGGLLNGNIGVLQTTVAEVVTYKPHQPRGFSVMPVVWCVGSIVGSTIGGALSDPVRNYGWSDETIFAIYPYLLPNLVCTVFVVMGLVIGIFFLEETHQDFKDRRDYGLEAGRSFLNLFKKSEPCIKLKRDYMEETLTLMHDDDFPPDYRSAASSPRLSPTLSPHSLPPPAYQSVEGTPRSSISDTALLLNHEDDCEALRKAAFNFASIFNRQVILNIVSYGILAYHTISTEQLLPVLFSLPPSEEPVHLPFMFSGGFGLPTKSIGGILSIQGIFQVIATSLIFPALSARVGSLRLLRMTVFTYPFLYLVVPYLTLLPQQLRMVCVYFILLWKVTAQAFTFPSVQILITNSVPSTTVLGTVNGAAASCASLSRALGPTISGLVQAAGLANGILGLPWWVNASVALFGVVLTGFMTEERSQDATSEKDQSIDHEYSGLLAIPDQPDTPIVHTAPTSPTLQRAPESPSSCSTS